VARAIERSRITPRAQTRRQLYEREAREDRAYSDWGYDLLDDAVPAFHKQPFADAAATAKSGCATKSLRDA
jgi:hypothetical protein